MTEMMRGCDGPETSAEACASCQMPAETSDPAVSEEAGPSTDQEMQWLSSREDCSLPVASLNTQLFLALPQGLSADSFRSPATETCEDLLSETSEDMCKDLSELPCEEMCVREVPGAPCKGRSRGAPCEEGRKAPAQGLFEEDRCGEPWAGKARLPSIVVEPSEGGDVESGELRWPPDDFSLLEEDEQDELFAEGEEEALGDGLSSFESDVEEVLL